MTSLEVLHYMDYFLFPFLMRVFFVMRMHRIVMQTEGGESLSHHYGVLISMLRVWVWFNPDGLKKKTYNMYAFKKL